MDFRGEFAGRTAIVTGGSRGIGEAIGRRLAAGGAAVMLAAREAAGAEEVAASIRASGGEATAAACDVRSSASVRDLVAAALDRHGRIDIVVNNAGISPLQAEPQDLPEQVWDDILDTNLKGAFLLAAAAAPDMIRRGGGAVVNISSIAGVSAIPLQAAYSASKSGLIGLTRGMAFDWARHGIRVNAIAPGYVATEMNRRVRERGAALAGSSPESIADPVDAAALRAYRQVVGKTLAGRFGGVAEIAEATAFLASDRASFITGETLTVDGGWTIGDGLA
ncbi:MAG: SDR family NAD(P)-dependent oxidoreductase [Chloroflexota bacterium]